MYMNQNQDFIEQMIHRKNKSFVNYALISVNIIVFFIVEANGGSEDSYNMLRFGAAYAPLIEAGEYYRLFTCMFLHFGFLHLANNMLLLFFVGDYVERYFGHVRYAIIYLFGGLCGSVLSFRIESASAEPAVSAGASGAIFAVIGALVVAAIVNKGRLYELTLNRIILMAALSLWTGFSSANVDGFAHLGGILGGAAVAAILVILRPRAR